MEDKNWSPDREYARLMWAALVILAVATLGSMLAVSTQMWLRSVGIVVLTTVAGGIGGAATGFLFGIPRVLTDAPIAPVATAGQVPDPQGNGQDNPPPRRRLLASNSNLEQVSDWLTKIILGIGLTQFYQLNSRLGDFEDLIRGYSPPADTTTPLVAVIMLIFSVVCGFLAMYLETRLVLSRIFDSVEGDLAKVNQEVQKQRAEKETAQALAAGLEHVVRDIASSAGTTRSVIAAAADSLKSVALQETAGPEIRTLAVSALAASGRPAEAAQLIPSNSPSVQDQISRMQVALYQAPPGGFKQAIQISGELSGSTEARSRSDYWLFGAAAFGQQHRFLRENNGSTQEQQSARDNALDFVRRCLTLDPTYVTWIRNLMNPEQSPSSVDDDLADFKDDPDFKDAVDQAAGAARKPPTGDPSPDDPAPGDDGRLQPESDRSQTPG